MKKIEAITYCHHYSDFLSETLPENKNFFDNYIVVTGKDDKKTIELCDLHNVACLKLDPKSYKKEEFRSHCLNYALSQLKFKEWVVNLDADIWLPPRTRNLLEKKHLNDEYIYGIDRLMCKSYYQWIEFRKRPKIHEGYMYMHLDEFPLGVRNVYYTVNGDGYVPIGFFQLWNIKGSGIKNYPEKHIKKESWQERVDTIHARRWNPEKRGFIPEIVGVHLESEESDMGINWDNGRKSPYFGGR